MTRAEAIMKLAEHDLAFVDSQYREDAVYAMWQLDEDDKQFHELPEVLQNKLTMDAFMPEEEDTDDPLFDPLVKYDLASRYVGARNAYLSKKLRALGYSDHQVEGKEPELQACPCCLFQTLAERGSYIICPVCFWEDDGTDKESDYSNPNHMTLGKGQNNFREFGACEKRCLQFVDIEGKQKYYKTRAL